MEVEMMIRIVAVVVGSALLLSNVDFNYILKYLKPLFNFKNRNPKPEINNNDTGSFLEIVDLWFKLKEKCENYKLKQAVVKLDEVFPLLNEEQEDV